MYMEGFLQMKPHTTYGGNGIFLIELSGLFVHVTAKYKTELLVLGCLSCVLSGDPQCNYSLGYCSETRL